MYCSKRVCPFEEPIKEAIRNADCSDICLNMTETEHVLLLDEWAEALGDAMYEIRGLNPCKICRAAKKGDSNDA